MLKWGLDIAERRTGKQAGMIRELPAGWTTSYLKRTHTTHPSMLVSTGGRIPRVKLVLTISQLCLCFLLKSQRGSPNQFQTLKASYVPFYPKRLFFYLLCFK